MKVRNFWFSDHGQATTEYVLLLSVMVGFAVLMARILKPAFANLTNRIIANIEGKIFKAGALHRLPFKSK